MAIPVHTLEQLDGSNFTRTDRVILGLKLGVANVAGGSNGTAVTTAVAFPASNLPVDQNGNPLYTVIVVPSQAGLWPSITGKTGSGFNVVLSPLSTATVAAGTFDVLVIG
jgi:hypothetical protein